MLAAAYERTMGTLLELRYEPRQDLLQGFELGWPLRTFNGIVVTSERLLRLGGFALFLRICLLQTFEGGKYKLYPCQI